MSTENPTYYDILDVTPQASRAEIKKAWQSKIQKYHPDMGGSEADPKKFAEVQKAYDILSDEENRKLYDLKLKPAPEPSKPTATAGANDNPLSWDYVQPTKEKVRRRPKPTVIPEWGQPAPEPQKEEEKQPHQIVIEPGAWEKEVKPDAPLTVTKSTTTLIGLPLLLAVAGAILFTLTSGTITGHQWGKPALAVINLGVPIAFGVLGSNWLMIKTRKTDSVNLADMTAAILLAAAIGVHVMVDKAIWVPLAVGLAAASIWCAARSITYMYVTTYHMPWKILSKNKMFSRPGAASRDTAGRITADYVATALEKVTTLPGLRTYFGVWTPANKLDVKIEKSVKTIYGATVKSDSFSDQILVAGNKVAIVNAAFLKAGHYSVNQWGNLLLNGQNIGVDLSAHNSIYERWVEKLGKKYEVRVIMAIISDGPTQCDPTPAGAEMIPVHKLANELGTWFIDKQDHINRELNAIIAQHLVD